MYYLIVAFILSAILTYAVRLLALKYNAVDSPDNKRHNHGRPVPLWGGLAIFCSFWLVVGYLIFFTSILDKHFGGTKLLGVFIGSLIILAIGLIDDVKNVSPCARLLITALAVLPVIFFGVHLDGITNPFGGVLSLDQWKFNLGPLGTFFVLGDLLVFLWIMGMSYTTKILDGLDGLTGGIAVIGSLMVYFLSMTKEFRQIDTAILALIFAGVCLGFLLYNFYPAKIFLGESGSLLVGFIVGVLAVIAGGKIATALLVMAVPILDLFRVMRDRVKRGVSLATGDRSHLHFKLVDSGIKPYWAVLIYYAVALLFGVTTLFLPSFYKLVALGLLLCGFFIAEYLFSKSSKYVKAQS